MVRPVDSDSCQGCGHDACARPEAVCHAAVARELAGSSDSTCSWRSACDLEWCCLGASAPAIPAYDRVVKREVDGRTQWHPLSAPGT